MLPPTEAQGRTGLPLLSPVLLLRLCHGVHQDLKAIPPHMAALFMEVEGYVAEDRGGGVSLSVSVHLPCTRTNSLDQAAAHASHHLGKSFLQRLL